jgi:hypothetical protein
VNRIPEMLDLIVRAPTDPVEEKCLRYWIAGMLTEEPLCPLPLVITLARTALAFRRGELKEEAAAN